MLYKNTLVLRNQGIIQRFFQKTPQTPACKLLPKFIEVSLHRDDFMVRDTCMAYNHGTTISRGASASSRSFDFILREHQATDWHLLFAQIRRHILVLSKYQPNATERVSSPHRSLTPWSKITVLAPTGKARQRPFISIWSDKDAMKEATSSRNASTLAVVDVWRVDPKRFEDAEVYIFLKLIDVLLCLLELHQLRAFRGLKNTLSKKTRLKRARSKRAQLKSTRLKNERVGYDLLPESQFAIAVDKEREAGVDQASVTGNGATDVTFYFENDTTLIDHRKLKAVQNAFFQV